MRDRGTKPSARSMRAGPESEVKVPSVLRRQSIAARGASKAMPEIEDCFTGAHGAIVQADWVIDSGFGPGSSRLRFRVSIHDGSERGTVAEDTLTKGRK